MSAKSDKFKLVDRVHAGLEKFRTENAAQGLHAQELTDSSDLSAFYCVL